MAKPATRSMGVDTITKYTVCHRDARKSLSANIADVIAQSDPNLVGKDIPLKETDIKSEGHWKDQEKRVDHQKWSGKKQTVARGGSVG